MKNTREWDETCPNCGARIGPDAKVCPECGSDENTGWSEEAQKPDLGLPEEDFDYDDFVQREFGGRPGPPRGVHWFWWVAAVITALALAAMWII